ncbi:MAG: metallophosphoesterase [Pseudomonadota bacterium]
MTKIILISDVHMTKPGDLIVGLDPQDRLAAVLSNVCTHHQDADHVIVMGDLAHYGSRAEYARLQNILARFDIPCPVALMPGNHDRRAGFHAVFGRAFAPFVVSTPSHDILCLDTLDEDAPDRHSGLVSDTQRRWIMDQIAASTKRIVVLAHHPFGPVGFDGMDSIALRNGADLADALQATGRIDLLVAGHIHRSISGTYRGLPFGIVTSPCHQMPFVLGPGSSALSDAGPGGYGVMLMSDVGVVLHGVTVGGPDTAPQQDAQSGEGH